MENPPPSDVTLRLLMGEVVLLRQTLGARLAQMRKVDPATTDEDTLAEMYEDRDALESLLDSLQQGYTAAFGFPMPDLPASYEAALSGRVERKGAPHG